MPASCMQLGANVSAVFVPSQAFNGCGAFHHNATGGAANGTPLNDTIPSRSTTLELDAYNLVGRDLRSKRRRDRD
jgi:hypothetical protein